MRCTHEKIGARSDETLKIVTDPQHSRSPYWVGSWWPQTMGPIVGDRLKR